jgi:hypothetical protein
MVKLQVLGNNSKTVNNIKNLTWGKNDQHSKIYLPCHFEVNLITHLGVVATKFGFHWFSTFRGEDFLKSLRRTTDDDDDDERQVMAIAHLTLRVR